MPKKSPFGHLKKGGLHRALHIKPSAKIPYSRLMAAKAQGGHLAKMAQFALNARKFKH
jgi:hypothetical protein